MKTPLRSLFLLVAALVLPAVVQAAAFEGKVRMKITAAGSKSAQEMTYSSKAGLLRTEIDGKGGESFAMIMNHAKREMIILMPEQKMYMVRPMPAMSELAGGDDGADDVKLEKTSETEKILGYTATKYVATSKEGVTDMWLTEELGSFMGFDATANANPMGGRPKAPAAWEKALMGKEFFPLRIVSRGKRNKEEFRLDVVAIEKQSLPDSVFAPPAGFQKFDMGAMMKGFGG